MVLGSSPVAVTEISDFVPASSKKFLDIQATIECGFTPKHIHDMTRTYNQMYNTDKYSEHSSILWQVRLNGWLFVYELSGSEFESSCSPICNWFVDNKLSIHFSEAKTKSIFFACKHRIKKLQKLEIIYNNICIKQHSRLSYLGCILKETMFGESMVYKLITKVNARLKLLSAIFY